MLDHGESGEFSGGFSATLLHAFSLTEKARVEKIVAD
jgi:hypothetical protein